MWEVYLSLVEVSGWHWAKGGKEVNQFVFKKVLDPLMFQLLLGGS